MFNVHHIYPRNAIDANGTNNRINKIYLSETAHTNWHRVFWNLEFHYQILRVLEMNTPIVQKKVLQDIHSIVTQDPKYTYENGVLRPKY